MPSAVIETCSGGYSLLGWEREIERRREEGHMLTLLAIRLFISQRAQQSVLIQQHDVPRSTCVLLFLCPSINEEMTDDDSQQSADMQAT